VNEEALVHWGLLRHGKKKLWKRKGFISATNNLDVQVLLYKAAYFNLGI